MTPASSFPAVAPGLPARAARGGDHRVSGDRDLLPLLRLLLIAAGAVLAYALLSALDTGSASAGGTGGGRIRSAVDDVVGATHRPDRITLDADRTRVPIVDRVPVVTGRPPIARDRTPAGTDRDRPGRDRPRRLPADAGAPGSDGAGPGGRTEIPDVVPGVGGAVPDLVGAVPPVLDKVVTGVVGAVPEVIGTVPAVIGLLPQVIEPIVPSVPIGPLLPILPSIPLLPPGITPPDGAATAAPDAGCGATPVTPALDLSPADTARPARGAGWSRSPAGDRGTWTHTRATERGPTPNAPPNAPPVDRPVSGVQHIGGTGSGSGKSSALPATSAVRVGYQLLFIRLAGNTNGAGFAPAVPTPPG